MPSENVGLASNGNSTATVSISATVGFLPPTAGRYEVDSDHVVELTSPLSPLFRDTTHENGESGR